MNGCIESAKVLKTNEIESNNTTDNQKIYKFVLFIEDKYCFNGYLLVFIGIMQYQ